MLGKNAKFFIGPVKIFLVIIIAILIINIKFNKDKIMPILFKREDVNQYVYSGISPHKYAIMNKDWKLIYYSDSDKYELYNLKDDKLEKNNLSGQKPGIAYELIQRLLEWQRKTKKPNNTANNHLDLTDEMKKRVREAGYW